MASNIGTLQQADRQAIFNSAQRLGVDPYQLGAVINQESGFRPNQYGGANGKYYGLIQFGPDEQKQYLDQKQMNHYSIAAQMPAVENYLTGRGYKPGMGVAKLYATILGGNPGVSLTAKDAFGTSVASSLPGFQPGGASYKQAQAALGGALPSNAENFPTQPGTSALTAPPSFSPSPVPTDFLNTFVNNLLVKPEKGDDGFGGLTQPIVSGATAPMLVLDPATQRMVATTPLTMTPEYQAFASRFIAG
jgi:hypothetical protein